MEQLKDELRNDYKIAVEYFNEKKYEQSLKNIRTTIILLSKFVIIDLIDNEEDAFALIEGNISFYMDRESNCWRISDKPAKHKPSGRDFPILMYKVFMYMHEGYCSVYADIKKKGIKDAMVGYGEGLAGFHSVTSEWNHEGSNLTAFSQAISTASYINGFFDFLTKKRILSDSSISFIQSLDKFDLCNDQDITSYKGRINELNGRITDLDETIKDRNGMIAEKSAKIKELEALVNYSNNSSVEETESYKKQLQARDEEIQQLKDECSKSNRELNDSVRQVSKLQSEKEKILAEKEKLSNQLKSAQKSVSKKESDRLKVIENNLSNLQAENESVKDSLQKIVKQYNQKQKELEKARLELNESKEKIKSLETELQSARCELALSRYQSQIESPVELESNNDNSVFEQFVVNLFALNKHKCFTRIESSGNEPEIVIKLSAYGKTKTFAVAIDYKSRWQDYNLKWDYLQAYQKYDKTIDGGFFFLLGVGGTPEKPRDLYIIPLSMFKKNKSLTKENLKDYGFRYTNGNLRYDMKNDVLNYVKK